VALLLPEPDTGGLPALSPLEPAELLGLGLLDEPDEPGTVVTVLAWLAEPGSRNAITPAAATPAAPAAAVRDRTIERPRSLAATALASLSRFMATSSARLIEGTCGFLLKRLKAPPGGRG